MQDEVKIGTPYVNLIVEKYSNTSQSTELPKYQNTVISRSAKWETQKATGKLKKWVLKSRFVSLFDHQIPSHKVHWIWQHHKFYISTL